MKTRSTFLLAGIFIALIVLVFLVGLDLGKQMATGPGQPTAALAIVDKTVMDPALDGKDLEEAKPSLRPSMYSKPALGHVMADNRIAEIAAQAAPSVVNVEAIPRVNPDNIERKRPLDISPFVSVNPLAPRAATIPEKIRPLTSGSGLIVRKDGYVITNNHLLRAGCELKVTLNDQRVFKANVVGRDKFTDLALLKIDADQLPVVPFGEPKSIRQGDWAIAIGNPLGFDHTVTLGIVSAINRTLSDLNNHVELIQTDAAINPGNSGGPLLNIRGEVIGLNSAIRNDAQNIGFAIPVDVLKQVSEGLIKDGSIVRPYLGVFMRDATNRAMIDANLPKDGHGVFILRIVEGSPAQRAGMANGDQIVKFGGVPVSLGRDIRRVVRNLKPGDVVEITIFRDGKEQVKKLTIGSYPKDSDGP